MHMDYEKGKKFKLPASTMLKANGTEFVIRKVDGMPLNEDYELTADTFSFVMTFDPMPDATEKLDFFIPGSRYCLNIRPKDWLPQGIANTYWRNDATGDWLATPVLQGTVTQVVGVIRAGANSNLDGRKLSVECSTDGGGTFTNVATWAATSWSNSQTRTVSCSLSAADGVQLRFYDCGTTDTGKTTVVLHRLEIKGTKELAAPEMGWLETTLSPAAAASGATWTVNGEAHASGEAVALAEGTYTVSFNALNGYIAPADTNATVVAGTTNGIAAAYVRMPGSLTVELLPEEAAAGASWQVSGEGVARASGETAILSPGTYTVSFGALAGFEAPEARTVEVVSGQGEAIEGTYAECPATLSVALSPATGTWMVSGEVAAHASGEAVALPAGTYTLSFGALDGYDPPEPVEIVLARGEVRSLSAAYTGNGRWTKGYDFTLGEGWSERATFFTGTTNVAGETWSMEGVKVFPTYATNGETGYLVLGQTGDWVELPPFSGCVTGVAAKVRAGAESDLENRKLALQYNLGHGWVDWSSWSCSSYTNVLSRSRTGSVSGGAAGVRLRVLDAGTGEVDKSTVVLHAITVRGGTDAGPAGTGTITATLTPATATWSVDGETYASGQTAEVVAGQYEVSFPPLDGYDAPAASNVTVAVGAAKSLKAAYAAQPGTLTVTLDPEDVRGTARWKTGGTTNASGDAVTLAAGTHSLSFTAVSGFTTPTTCQITVPPGGAVATNVAYAVKPASLKVTLKPADGTWKVAGTNYESGATAKLPPRASRGRLAD